MNQSIPFHRITDFSSGPPGIPVLKVENPPVWQKFQLSKQYACMLEYIGFILELCAFVTPVVCLLRIIANTVIAFSPH